MNDRRDSIDSPFGMDAALKMKRQASYDWGAEASVQSWLEELIGEAFPSTFADSLKSGQILCKVVNVVKPGTIPKIETSSMSFKQMENISYFLRACRALGVREHECFETLDLYQEKDLGVVVKCIIAFSRAIKKSVPEFAGPHLTVRTDMAPPPVNVTLVEQDQQTVFRTPAATHWSVSSPSSVTSAVSGALGASPPENSNKSPAFAPLSTPTASGSSTANELSKLGVSSSNITSAMEKLGIAASPKVSSLSSSPKVTSPPLPPTRAAAGSVSTPNVSVPAAPPAAPATSPTTPTWTDSGMTEPPVIVAPTATTPSPSTYTSAAPTSTPAARATPAASSSSKKDQPTSTPAPVASLLVPTPTPTAGGFKSDTPPSLERARSFRVEDTAVESSRQSERSSLEKSITEWIEKVTGIKREIPAFGEWLKSGDVLCALVNGLSPGAIPKYNQNTKMPFKMMENVSLFLRAIRSMGVREHECFDTSDLFDEKDLPQVLSTLAALGRGHGAAL